MAAQVYVLLLLVLAAGVYEALEAIATLRLAWAYG
jgi:hypothetical protein